MKTTLELLLEAMIMESWDEEWGGDVDAPTGSYARLSIQESDLPDVGKSFHEILADEESFDLTSLVGEWIYRKDDHGFPHPELYSTEAEAIARFEELEQAFDAWFSEDEVYV
ncbi:hypothetical protein WC1_59 [Rhodococcus phage WC1]|uniref:Uncharacterized protein n=3 Tax=Rerduovirus TaxID=1982375 RepID=G9FHV2_9CAUD|nr:hypothetical protein RoPhRER2_gp52 [Rhodococcus phage RER2]YP_009189712.1 hypothetical protein AU091_gp14 [Rhodococcus phage CosmicSans]YP_009834099.1 hypothetical protein HWB24_gp13 [Rhodococcus phage Hiro]ALA46262.1 hypothetical protein PBI_RHODALYSA_59 [Rhodococcus phage Rhodalysa]ALN97103.1 hypothetical protein SEA_TWAMP_59 [Rhodococcus phage TWAMP]ALO80657.1 hypothetical protein SEA_LILLIE_59 [Rhodococcus phage Lillie]AOZ62815.1 hypothetical protein SEA_YOGI_60 [Rhodococcus phage Yogi